MQLAHQGFVGHALCEVESGQIAVSWEARNAHLVGDGTHFPFGHFRLQQIAQYGLRALIRGSALCSQLGHRLCHAKQLE